MPLAGLLFELYRYQEMRCDQAEQLQGVNMYSIPRLLPKSSPQYRSNNEQA